MTMITKKKALEIIKTNALEETFVEGNMSIGETNFKKWSKPFGFLIIQKGKNHHFYMEKYEG